MVREIRNHGRPVLKQKEVTELKARIAKALGSDALDDLQKAFLTEMSERLDQSGVHTAFTDRQQLKILEFLSIAKA
jgi:hypothetical protein